MKALVSVAYTPEEAAEYAGPATVGGNPGDGPKFPWGLCVELNDDTLKKLGITELPPVGAMLMLMAHVQVASISENQQLDGDKEGRVSLQITEMALGAPTDGDAATKLWPAE